MSCQERIMSLDKVIYIERLRNALQAYRGFTQREKNYAHLHIPIWVQKRGELETFIKKFHERFSIDIQPFLYESKFMRRV